MNPDLMQSIHARRRTAGDKAIAAAIDGDATKVSRIFSQERGVMLDEIEPFLDALGLRLIPKADHIVELPEAHYQSLVLMAGEGQRAMERGEVHRRYAVAAHGEKAPAPGDSDRTRVIR